jgi:hypothetical protein
VVELLRRPIWRLLPLAAVCGLAMGCGTSQSLVTAVPRADSPAVARCPEKKPADPSAETWRAAQRVLAPSGVAAILLCRYGGGNVRPPLMLLSWRRIADSDLVGELVSEFDRLPAPPAGAVSCPFDDGSAITARLAYPDGHAVTLSVALGGCAIVTNGSVVRTAWGVGAPPAFGLIRQLASLVGLGWLAGVHPPAPRVTTLRRSLAATLLSYCWTVRGPHRPVRGNCTSSAGPARTLAWRAGARVVIDLRLPAHNVQFEAIPIPEYGSLRLRAVRLDRLGRRWMTRLPRQAKRDSELTISARFANGYVYAYVGLKSAGPHG